MHMADALLSPAVGLGLWALAAGSIVHCSRRVGEQLDERQVPLMGVLGAFLFSAQMINFSIPGTGSSGHLAGGLLLAILLGPHAAVLVIAAVLIVQALFFADGGLLALGCNIVNLGVLPAFVAYPLVYLRLAGADASDARRSLAAIAAALVGLQLGALGVVVETVASGRSALSFATFAVFMQSIHLAIGIVEGLVIAALVAFIARARPDLPYTAGDGDQPPWWQGNSPGLSALLLLAALLVAALLSPFAASDPDGLEWSIARAADAPAAPPTGAAHRALAALQERTALLPDYAFRKPEATTASAGQTSAAAGQPPAAAAGGRPDGSLESLGSSLAGVLGGAILLALALLIGAWLRWRRRPAP